MNDRIRQTLKRRCYHCNEIKTRDAYSNRSWKRRDCKSMCKQCIASGHRNPSSKHTPRTAQKPHTVCIKRCHQSIMECIPISPALKNAQFSFCALIANLILCYSHIPMEGIYRVGHTDDTHFYKLRNQSAVDYEMHQLTLKPNGTFKWMHELFQHQTRASSRCFTGKYKVLGALCDPNHNNNNSDDNNHEYERNEHSVFDAVLAKHKQIQKHKQKHIMESKTMIEMEFGHTGVPGGYFFWYTHLNQMRNNLQQIPPLYTLYATIDVNKHLVQSLNVMQVKPGEFDNAAIIGQLFAPTVVSAADADADADAAANHAVVAPTDALLTLEKTLHTIWVLR